MDLADTGGEGACPPSVSWDRSEAKKSQGNAITRRCASRATVPNSKCTEAYIGLRERLMLSSVKEQVAECYRRAEEFKELSDRALNLDEREMYLSTVRQFLRLAKNLETA
jgi:hypothetical protein